MNVFQKWASEIGLTATIVQTKLHKKMMRGMKYAWHVTLSLPGGRSYELLFFTNLDATSSKWPYGQQPLTPKLDSILECLQSDCLSLDCCPLFPDWHAECSSDREVYDAVVEQYCDTRKFLGKHWQAFLKLRYE